MASDPVGFAYIVLALSIIGSFLKVEQGASSAGFLEVDKAMNATKIDCEFSGTTACVAFLEGRLLNVAWVGDSRGVMGRAKIAGHGFEAVNMTTDHKPTCKEEQARIVASSGRVERCGFCQVI